MLKITNMKPLEAEQIVRIANECGLSFWSEGNYQIETKRENSFVKTARFEKEIVGFIVARLIMSYSTDPYYPQISTPDSPPIIDCKTRNLKAAKLIEQTKI